jgi:hypothetical protein
VRTTVREDKSASTSWRNRAFGRGIVSTHGRGCSDAAVRFGPVLSQILRTQDWTLGPVH